MLIVAIVRLACRGHAQDGDGGTPGAAVSPAAPVTAAQPDPWWCVNADYGGTRICVSDLPACRRIVSGTAARGRQVTGGCETFATAWCYRVEGETGTDGHTRPRCSATIGACRAWRDVTLAKGTADAAIGECVERRPDGRTVAEPSPGASSPRWWCTVTGAPFEKCQREASLCEFDLRDAGAANGKCEPRDRAECFARQLPGGLAQLGCTPDHLTCVRFRGVALSDARWGKVTSECAERR